MYDNIGKKIQGLAKAYAIGGSVLFVFLAIILIAINDRLLLPGFLFMIIGPVACFISSLKLYGFGEIIESVNKVVHYNDQILSNFTSMMQQNQEKDQKQTEPLSPQQSLLSLKNLQEQNLISEETYQAKRAEILSKL